MQLVASPILTEEDIQAIREGYRARQDMVTKALLQALEKIPDSITEQRLGYLAWLIAEERLDIRVAVPISEQKTPKSGIYHEKLGIFQDSLGNTVAFTGSPNETAGGLVNNFETIDVFCSWQDPQERVRRKRENFEKLWSNQTAGLDVIEFPEAARRQLLQHRPKQPLISEPQLQGSSEEDRNARRWRHQVEAVTEFLKLERGILEMATGTGKTRTALRICERLFSDDLIDTVVVSADGNDLLDQWYTTTDDKTAPEALYSLKDRLRHGPVDIQILAVNRFEATLSGVYFNQAVRRELYDGFVRIKQLEKSVQALTAGNAATAWLLTTCYYTSFFAAIEILRCSGSYVSYFHSEAISRIKQKAAPVADSIEEGTYEGSAEFDANTGEVTVTFVKRKIRHHELTWQQLKRIVTQTRKDLTGMDAIHQEHLEKFIGSDASPFWPSPSDVRNRWNYEDASLFGKNGETVGAEFRKLARNKTAALNWGGQKKVICTNIACASSVAFIMNALLCTMEELSAVLLPESLSKVLPRS